MHGNLVDYIIKMLELKTIDLKLKNPNLQFNDVIDYFLNVVLNNRKLFNVSDSAYYIFNIKFNRVMEYLNAKGICDENITLDSFKDMFISKNK